VTIIAAEPRISETTSHTGANDVHPWAGRAVMTKISGCGVLKKDI